MAAPPQTFKYILDKKKEVTQRKRWCLFQESKDSEEIPELELCLIGPSCVIGSVLAIIEQAGLISSPNTTWVLFVSKRKMHIGQATGSDCHTCWSPDEVDSTISFFLDGGHSLWTLTYRRYRYLKDLVRILYCCPLSTSIFNPSTYNFGISVSSGCEPQLVHLQLQCPPPALWGPSFHA